MEQQRLLQSSSNVEQEYGVRNNFDIFKQSGMKCKQINLLGL